MKKCALSAKDNNGFGVWGGVYWNAARMDDYRNAHKTAEVWEKIKARLSE
jgi:hypothetical protein